MFKTLFDNADMNEVFSHTCLKVFSRIVRFGKFYESFLDFYKYQKIKYI